jgi:Arc/MetJ family transcription regulator/GTPase SAR1 family protein
MYAHDDDKSGAEKALWSLARQNQTDLGSDDQDPGIYLTDTNGAVGDQGGGDEAAMRTVLRAFADEFSEQMEPLIEPMSGAIRTLENAAESCRARAVLGNLRDLQHQVSTLIEKVEAQQAYVLIFGPLKSGKSTFMNAMCGSYISEVTALPAYPCLVNVSHSDRETFSITRYDGRTEDLEDRDLLRRRIEADHVALIERIREVEASGESFDPIGHMSEAIRKIDVKLPAGQLGSSGAVLVDTPGLYTKMKFGYDRMTRDFRNSAACAIFIVKTDNLFLEQVFDEFGELLQLFSRVFLVVNLDHSKRDLQPDGSLAPSLEREDPERIVQTFKDLSMSAPLAEAADAGRLHIYPVDLLRSASRRIRGQSDHEEATPGAKSFEDLAGDLGAYLNSNEYLREFLADSVRRAHGLLEELGEVTNHESVQDLADQQRMLRGELESARQKRKALQRVAKIDWNHQLSELANEITAQLGQETRRLHETATMTLSGAIESWFETDDSLDQLSTQRVQGVLDGARDTLGRVAREQISRLSADGARWLTDASVREDLRTAGLDLPALLASAVRAGGQNAGLTEVESALACENIPVRKTLWDWLLLRSVNKVRRKVMGDGGEPIDPDTKAKRLGDAGRDAMRRLVVDQLESLLSEGANDLPRRVVAGAVQDLSKAVARESKALTGQVEQQIQQTEALLAQAQKILGATDELRDAVNNASSQLESLDESYAWQADEAQDDEQDDERQAQSQQEAETIELEP